VKFSNKGESHMSYRKKVQKDQYKDEPYVTLVRVSDYSEEQDSDEAQLEYLKKWAGERKMVWVKDYVETDLSGSLPGNREDIAALLKRAEEKKDFRYVLAQRIDRATRGGVDHLFWLEHELRRRNVRILYPGDNLPEDVPYARSLRAFKADAAQEQSFSTSQRSTQGSQYALERRHISPHSRTPFGTYRLYCRSDSEQTPLFVIKDLRDGRQEKLSWPDLKVIDTYGQIGGKAKGHYRKQKSELVFLVLGDPKEQEIVILIFRLHYIEGFGGRKIAGILNERGYRAPMGGTWSPRQVESIYENEDYTIKAFANRKSQAFYHSRQTGYPKRVEMDDITATTAERIKPELRPKSEWFETTEPYLEGYLGDENLRQIAIAQQARTWERRLDPTWERKNKTKHPRSPYLLGDILIAKQDGEALVGSRSGKADRPVRIYRHKRAARECLTRSIYNRVLNAESLERAVLAVLQQILLDWPELEPRLLAHVQHQIATGSQQDVQLQTKRQHRAEVGEQLLLYVRMLTPKTQKELAAEITRLESQRDSLDAEIEMLEKIQSVEMVDPSNIAAAVKARLSNLAESIPSLPPNVVKQVLAALTASLVVDMETKEVDFAFHLPSWAVWEPKNFDFEQLCMRTSQEFSTGTHTHRDNSLFLPLGDGNCRFTYPKSQSVDCHCRRRLRQAA
jgi:Resolvase, N terminal domain/Recombinase